MKVWAYLHPKLNVLHWALSKEAVPQGVEAIEFDVESVNDIIYDGVRIRLKTEAEKLEDAKQRKLDELGRYVATLLAPTDYVVIKISEAQLFGDTKAVKQLRQQYAAQLQERRAIRQWNRQITQAIKNAQTLEELRNIQIRFVPPS